MNVVGKNVANVCHFGRKCTILIATLYTCFEGWCLLHTPYHIHSHTHTQIAQKLLLEVIVSKTHTQT